MMMTLVNMSSEGLLVLATHRVLEGLADFSAAELLSRAGEYFNIEKLASAEELQKRIDAAGDDASAIGGVFEGDPAAYLFTAKPGALDAMLAGMSDAEKRLDVVVLHKALIGAALGVTEQEVEDLKGISYIRGFQSAVNEVREGGKQAAFLLRPVKVHEVADISFGGGVMPQKSTDFYPKLLSGFTTYRFG